MKKLILLFLFGTSTLYAQRYLGDAVIAPVPADGFYNLQLAAEWVPYLNEDMSNIRIFDKKNQEVPYIYREEEPVSFTRQFRQYEIVEKRQEKNCCTSILLRNSDVKPINNISLSIKNAEVTKYANLLGSDDNKNWYALKQQFTITSIDGDNNTSVIKIVDFPLSNYSYYLLRIDDSTSAPINILSAGFYEVNAANGSYNSLASQFHQADSASLKSTYGFIKFNGDQIVDKMAFDIEGPPYFLRQATLHQKMSQVNIKGDTIYYFQPLTNFTITSRQSTVLELNDVRAEELMVIIDNDDNPSLHVKQVYTYQLNRYFTAWLKGGESYTVRIGEKSLASPRYDIAYFRESINSILPVIHAAGLVVVPVVIPEAQPPMTPTFFTNKNIIWIAVILVVIVFGFMAVSITRDMEKDKK